MPDHIVFAHSCMHIWANRHTHTHTHRERNAHTQRNAHTKIHSRYPDALALWEGPRNNHNSLLASLRPLTSALSGQQVIGEAVAHQPPPLRVPSVSSLFIILCMHPGLG